MNDEAFVTMQYRWIGKCYNGKIEKQIFSVATEQHSTVDGIRITTAKHSNKIVGVMRCKQHQNYLMTKSIHITFIPYT
jgi:hypothetical protein